MEDGSGEEDGPFEAVGGGVGGRAGRFDRVEFGQGPPEFRAGRGLRG